MLRITSALGLLPQGCVCVPCGCHGRVPRATPVMCCALSVLQTLVIKVCGVILSVVGGLAVGKVRCTELSDVLLTCWSLLLALVSQPVTGPVLGTLW